MRRVLNIGCQPVSFECNLVPRVFIPDTAMLDETSDSRKFRCRIDFDWFSKIEMTGSKTLRSLLNHACKTGSPMFSDFKSDISRVARFQRDLGNDGALSGLNFESAHNDKKSVNRGLSN